MRCLKTEKQDVILIGINIVIVIIMDKIIIISISVNRIGWLVRAQPIVPNKIQPTEYNCDNFGSQWQWLILDWEIVLVDGRIVCKPLQNVLAAGLELESLKV